MRKPEFLSEPGEIVVSDVMRAWLLKGADEIEQVEKPYYSPEYRKSWFESMTPSK